MEFNREKNRENIQGKIDGFKIFWGKMQPKIHESHFLKELFTTM